MEYLLRNISNVKELKEALEKIPEETPLSPCGSPTMAFAYDSENKLAYLDEEATIEEIEEELDM